MDLKQKLAERLKQYKLLLSFAAKQKTKKQELEGVSRALPSLYRGQKIAKKLSEPFPFCRVDLYNIDGSVYFGEITFYHGGGCNSIEPEEWDYRLGSWININSPKIVR